MAACQEDTSGVLEPETWVNPGRLLDSMLCLPCLLRVQRCWELLELPAACHRSCKELIVVVLQSSLIFTAYLAPYAAQSFKHCTGVCNTHHLLLLCECLTN
jgi:hypothetical protein